MLMLGERACGDEVTIREIKEWSQRREKRHPVLRGLARPLHRAGIMGEKTDMAGRDYAIARRHAIATRHGLGMMGRVHRDWESGLLAGLMGVDLHAVGPDGATVGLFPDMASGRAFLDGVRGASLDGLGRMARTAVIPERGGRGAGWRGAQEGAREPRQAQARPFHGGLMRRSDP